MADTNEFKVIDAPKRMPHNKYPEMLEALKKLPAGKAVEYVGVLSNLYTRMRLLGVKVHTSKLANNKYAVWLAE